MSEQINHPPHYTFSHIECIEAIEAWGLGFCLGNCVKYIVRAGRKDQSKKVEDLKKALWYLERQIQYIEKTEGKSVKVEIRGETQRDYLNRVGSDD